MGTGARNPRYDTSLGTVHVISKTGDIPDWISTWLGSSWPRTGHWFTEPGIPNVCDYYLTTLNLTARIEQVAASHGAMVVVLPEGGNYLYAKMSERIGAGRPVYLRSAWGDS